MFRLPFRFLAGVGQKSVTKRGSARKTARPALGLEELGPRVVLSTATFGVQDWGTQVFTPYSNVLVDTSFNYASAAQAGNFKFITLGFITADNAGNPSWDGDAGSELGSPGDLQVQAQVDSLRNNGGDVMISFGGEDDGGGQSTELARYVAATMGTGADAVTQLVSDYQQVIDAYHLTHVDFDIEGDAESDGPSIILRSEALAQLQQNNPGLQVYFTLGGDIPQDDDLQFGMDGSAMTIVNSALDNGVNLAGVNLMTMDFSNNVNYFNNTTANQQLYQQQLNPNGWGYAGDDANEQGISNVADVVLKNASAEFTQLQQALSAHGTARTDAQVWQMVGVTPEIGRNSTADQSNVIFSLADAQTVETFAQQNGIGRISMWSIERDQPGADPATHTETDSSIQQNPYAFSQIFSAFSSGTQGGQGTPSAPTGLSATAGDGQVTLNWTPVAGANSYNVYRGTASGQESWLQNVPDASFTDSGLTDGTTYYYTVTAGNGNLESAQSSEVSATPAQAVQGTPSAPTGLTAAADDGQVTLNWTPVAGADSYNLYRGTASGQESWLQNVSSASFTDSGLTDGTTYYYTVTAGNGNLESAQSSEVSATPAQPQGNTVSGAVVVEVPGSGILRFEAATGWVPLIATDATQLASSSSGDVVASLVTGGIWRYEDATGWQKLSSSNASSITGLAIDTSGDVVAALAGKGVFRYEDTTGWQRLTRAQASAVAIDSSGDVAAALAGKGVFRYEDATGWKRLSKAQASTIAIDSNADVVVTIAGRGIYRYEDGSNWTKLSPSSAVQLAVDSAGDVVAEINGSGIWLFENSTSQWTNLKASDAAQVGITDSGDVVGLFSGQGVSYYEAANGWEQLGQMGAVRVDV